MIPAERVSRTTWLAIILAVLYAVPPRMPLFPANVSGHAPGEILVRLQAGVDPHVITDDPDIRALMPVGTTRRPVSSLRPDIQLICMGNVGLRREQAVLAALRRSPRVAAASLNFRRRPARQPRDPLYTRQWNLSNRGNNAPLIPGIAGADIGAETIWEIETGNSAVVVAVVDTGIDYEHPDLAANIWRNPLETPDNGIDDDGNGYVDDWLGYDFAMDANGGNDTDPMDTDGHGTHVAGIIAARGDNARGVAGISWQTRLLAVKTVRPDGYTYSDDIVEALEYIQELKRSGTANIVAVNCSFGGSGYSEVEEQAYRQVSLEGIVILAAAGNGGDDDSGDNNDEHPFYPASYDVSGILSVTATTAEDKLADFSNYGFQSVDLAAPGEGVLSTVPRQSGRLAQVDSLFGTTPALGLEYAGPTTGVTALLVPCGLGLTALDFPPDVDGAVALIERGENTFQEKIRLASRAGAKAAIIFNNRAGNFSGTLQVPGEWIPAVSISRENGINLKTRVFTPVTVTNQAADYDYMSGTSMATPHAAGATALLASLFGPEPVSRRVARLIMANTPLPHLADRIVCGGRLDLKCLTLPPPLEVTAIRRRNQSLLQTEYVVQITWRTDPRSLEQGVSGYRLFQSSPDFRIIASLDAGTSGYQIRRVSRERELELGVAVLDRQGNCGTAAFAVVRDE
ncbi:MAG: S8 family serine peptidase [Candidatus Aminicenantes bacterium]|nr:S8 family serine peptidase [Candidatus Aminicenantes bacterium]